MDNTGYGMKMMTVMISIHCILGLFFVEFARCNASDDTAKCSDELVTVATCLPYVGGEAKAPTRDCCAGFKSALDNRPECICLLIKDRDDPSLGLQINATLAIQLPAKCKINTSRTISDCPAILNLPPNSPDAKVFDEFGNTGKKSNATAPSPATSARSTSVPGPVQITSSHNGVNRRQPSRLETVSLLLLAMSAAPILASTTCSMV